MGVNFCFVFYSVQEVMSGVGSGGPKKTQTPKILTTSTNQTTSKYHQLTPQYTFIPRLWLNCELGCQNHKKIPHKLQKKNTQKPQILITNTNQTA